MRVAREITRWVGARPWIKHLSPLILCVDRVLYRRTQGRKTVVGLAGLPSLILTVNGRRTNQPRVTPLLYVPDGPDYIITGSNWGGPDHPQWTENLLVQGQASVNVRGRVTPVKAHLLTDHERQQMWPALTRDWPAYNLYAARARRELRIFRLTPANAVQ
jgi:deazaflavin-dependent oxidoreductase (nitroreductase family)